VLQEEAGAVAGPGEARQRPGLEVDRESVGEAGQIRRPPLLAAEELDADRPEQLVMLARRLAVEDRPRLGTIRPDPQVQQHGRQRRQLAETQAVGLVDLEQGQLRGEALGQGVRPVGVRPDAPSGRVHQQTGVRGEGGAVAGEDHVAVAVEVRVGR
jgi:hypothetical protein